MASANSAPPPGGELDHVASTAKAILGCIAFALFWLMAVFPSVRFLPIGRTAGAVMSAAFMVAFKVLTPSEAFAAVNLPTVGLLFGTMIVSTFLERAGAFEYLGWLLAWRSLGGADLLCRLCVFSAISAALLTNDTTCVILTSFILSLCRARSLPPQPYLIGLATSANIGSALTPIGNPQNLIISINGRVSFGRFLVGLIAPVVVSVAVNTLGLLVVYARRLSKKRLRKRFAESEVKELGLTVEGQRSGPVGQGIVERIDTGSEAGLETGLETGLEPGLEPGLKPGKTGMRTGLKTGSHVDLETGLDGKAKVENGINSPKESFMEVEGTEPAGTHNGTAREETGTDSEPEPESGIGHGSLEPQSSGIGVLIDEEPGGASRPADGRWGPESNLGSRNEGLEASNVNTHSEVDEKESASRGNNENRRFGGAPANEAQPVTGTVTVTRSDLDGLTDPPSLSDRPLGFSPVSECPSVQGNPAQSIPPGVSVVPDNPSSPANLPRNTPPGVSLVSDKTLKRKDPSDGLRTRSKPRPHQVEVLVPFPDLEHPEGVPAVAPTWRGRLKRLRKKRPRWVFKASVYLVVVGMLAALLAGLDLPWVAMGAAVILIVLDFRDAEETLDQVSYSLLVFFSGMFIAVEGFNRTGIPGQIWAWLEPHARLDSATGTILLAVVVTLLSNVASNVPTVLLLGPRVAASAASTAGISETYAWLFLAFTSTVAGNLTMVGSAANLIVSEEAFRAKDGMKYKLSFWNHLRYGLPSTIVILAVGIPLTNG